MICLDTNVAIGVVNRRPLTLVSRFEREAARTVLHLPVVSLFELRNGIAKSDRPGKSAARLAAFLQYPVVILPFNPDDATEAGNILAQLEKAGTPIGPYDVLIAAQARSRGATLVTANTREFSRVPRLALEDWTQPENA